MRLEERVEFEAVLVAVSSAITAGKQSSGNSRWTEILPGLEKTPGRLIEGENVRRRSTRLVERVQLGEEQRELLGEDDRGGVEHTEPSASPWYEKAWQ
jgi:hypothetical protein